MRWHLETFRQENTFVLVGENCAYVSNSYHVYKTNWGVFDIQKVFFIKYCTLLSIKAMLVANIEAKQNQMYVRST